MKESGSAALRLGVAVVVLAAAYVGVAWFLGRHLPANTSVSGVPVGGMTPASAEATLRRALADKGSATIVLQAGDRTVQLDPASAGLALDLHSTVIGLSRFSLRPADLWSHLTGGQDEPLQTSVDRARLDDALTKVRATLDTAVVEGAITFPAGQVSVVRPVAGTELSVDDTARVLTERWPASGPIAARVTTTPTSVSAAEVDRATREFATPAMSAPVTVVVGAKSFTLQPAEFAAALSMQADAQGRLAPVVDDALLLAAVRQAAAGLSLEKPAQDASYTLKGATPVVVPSVPGVGFDPRSLVAAFLPALTSPVRTATVAMTAVQPTLTTVQAERAKPTHPISTFTTYLPDNPPRTTNITIAARTLNGTYVRPGQQLSLNGVLGEPTPAKGYQQAPMIEEGRLTTGYGGGVSQLSTTMFNAAFFAGVRIDHVLPHSVYLSRYPEGREATVSWPDVDQTWTNDTGAGILIQAGVVGKAVTVTFYGTKVWDIASVKGARRNVVQPKAIVDSSPGCVPQSASPGFDVTVSRGFSKAGATVKTSTFTTHYRPQDQVTCTHP